MVYAALQDDKKSFVVRTLLNEERTCDLDFSTTKLKSKWLAKRYIHLFRENPNLTLNLDDLKIDVTKWQFYNARVTTMDSCLFFHFSTSKNQELEKWKNPVGPQICKIIENNRLAALDYTVVYCGDTYICMNEYAWHFILIILFLKYLFVTYL